MQHLINKINGNAPFGTDPVLAQMAERKEREHKEPRDVTKWDDMYTKLEYWAQAHYNDLLRMEQLQREALARVNRARARMIDEADREYPRQFGGDRYRRRRMHNVMQWRQRRPERDEIELIRARERERNPRGRLLRQRDEGDGIFRVTDDLTNGELMAVTQEDILRWDATREELRVAEEILDQWDTHVHNARFDWRRAREQFRVHREQEPTHEEREAYWTWRRAREQQIEDEIARDDLGGNDDPPWEEDFQGGGDYWHSNMFDM